MSKLLTLVLLIGIVNVESIPVMTMQPINTGLNFNFCAWQASLNQILSNFSNSDQTLLRGILYQIQEHVGLQSGLWDQIEYSINKNLTDSILASPDAPVFMQIIQLVGYNVPNYGSGPLWDLCNMTNQFNTLVGKLSLKNKPAAYLSMNTFLLIVDHFLPDILNKVYSINYDTFYNLIGSNNAGMTALADLFAFSSDSVLSFNPCSWETSLKSVLSRFTPSQQTSLKAILLQIQVQMGAQIPIWNDQQYNINRALIEAIRNSTDANVFMQLGQLIGYNVTNPGAAPLWNLCNMTSQFFALVQKLSAKYRPAAYICMNTFFSVAGQNVPTILDSVYNKNLATFSGLMSSNIAAMTALGELFNMNGEPAPMSTTTTAKPKTTTLKLTTKPKKPTTTTTLKPTTTTKKPTTSTKKPTTTTLKSITTPKQTSTFPTPIKQN